MACYHRRAGMTGRVFRLSRGVFALIVMALAAACAGGPSRPPTGTPEPDKFLYERGTEALDKKKWLTAREYFRELIDTYPQTPLPRRRQARDRGHVPRRADLGSLRARRKRVP